MRDITDLNYYLFEAAEPPDEPEDGNGGGDEEPTSEGPDTEFDFGDDSGPETSIELDSPDALPSTRASRAKRAPKSLDISEFVKSDKEFLKLNPSLSLFKTKRGEEDESVKSVRHEVTERLKQESLLTILVGGSIDTKHSEAVAKTIISEVKKHTKEAGEEVHISTTALASQLQRMAAAAYVLNYITTLLEDKLVDIGPLHQKEQAVRGFFTKSIYRFIFNDSTLGYSMDPERLAKSIAKHSSKERLNQVIYYMTTKFGPELSSKLFMDYDKDTDLISRFFIGDIVARASVPDQLTRLEGRHHLKAVLFEAENAEVEYEGGSSDGSDDDDASGTAGPGEMNVASSVGKEILMTEFLNTQPLVEITLLLIRAVQSHIKPIDLSLIVSYAFKELIFKYINRMGQHLSLRKQSEDGEEILPQAIRTEGMLDLISRGILVNEYIQYCIDNKLLLFGSRSIFKILFDADVTLNKAVISKDGAEEEIPETEIKTNRTISYTDSNLIKLFFRLVGAVGTTFQPGSLSISSIDNILNLFIDIERANTRDELQQAMKSYETRGKIEESREYSSIATILNENNPNISTSSITEEEIRIKGLLKQVLNLKMFARQTYEVPEGNIVTILLSSPRITRKQIGSLLRELGNYVEKIEALRSTKAPTNIIELEKLISDSSILIASLIEKVNQVNQILKLNIKLISPIWPQNPFVVNASGRLANNVFNLENILRKIKEESILTTAPKSSAEPEIEAGAGTEAPTEVGKETAPKKLSVAKGTKAILKETLVGLAKKVETDLADIRNRLFSGGMSIRGKVMAYHKITKQGSYEDKLSVVKDAIKTTLNPSAQAEGEQQPYYDKVVTIPSDTSWHL